MSQTFSPRHSPSSDDPGTEYNGSTRRFPFLSQGAETAPVSTNTSFASQGSDTSIATSVTSPEQRPVRTLDVSTILNPTPQRSVESPGRRPFSHFGSPGSAARPSSQHGPGRQSASSPRGQELGASSDRALRGSETFPQRIPPSGPTRSHHVSRSSLSSLGNNYRIPSMAYESPRRSTPFQAENLQPSQHRSRAPPPPAPPPPPGPQQPTGLPFPQVSTPVQRYSPRFSIGGTPLSSASASPVSSFASSYGQSGQSPMTTAPTFSSGTFRTMPQTPGAGTQSESFPYTLAGPSAQSAQGSTGPIMHFNTAQGTMHIPIDTTAASRSADEKRKRNAGASARFRARRKEREREMSTRIAELEQRVKKAEEERDYYRNLWRQQNQREPPPPPPHTAGIGRGDVSREGFGQADATSSRVESERIGGQQGSGISGMNPEQPRRGFNEREGYQREDSSLYGFGMKGQQPYRKERD